MLLGHSHYWRSPLKHPRDRGTNGGISGHSQMSAPISNGKSNEATYLFYHSRPQATGQMSEYGHKYYEGTHLSTNLKRPWPCKLLLVSCSYIGRAQSREYLAACLGQCLALEEVLRSAWVDRSGPCPRHVCVSVEVAARGSRGSQRCAWHKHCMVFAGRTWLFNQRSGYWNRYVGWECSSRRLQSPWYLIKIRRYSNQNQAQTTVPQQLYSGLPLMSIVSETPNLWLWFSRY